ncbi:hypothetical protein GF420_12445, partial [candidate division GN15 bacterium]|nr:hypothetical protein [candidate division GN15 bacterium]
MGYYGSVYALSSPVGGSDLFIGGRFSNGAYGRNITLYDRFTGAFTKLGDVTTPSQTEVLAVHRIGPDTVIIGGDFPSINDDSSMAYLALWDGQAWSPINGTGDGLDGAVRAITTFAGDIYVGGVFTQVDGQAIEGVAYWDGDNWSGLLGGLDGSSTVEVNDLETFNQSIWIGGQFETADGASSANLAIWSGNAFLTPPGTTDGPINDLHLHTDGQ